MRFYFIRHGQSENNALWDETGSSKGRSEDPELTKSGHEQARLLGNYIRTKDLEARSDGVFGRNGRDAFLFTHLYTSLMVRSVMTGTYISRALEIPLQAWPEIHECGGIYQEGENNQSHTGLPGKTRSYFAVKYPNLILPETVTDDGWWNRPFESHEHRPLRAQTVVNLLIERHGGTDDRVAIVSHGGFYMELMRVLFKICEPQAWYLMNNTAVSRFDFHDNGEIVLMYHNRTDHLPANMIT